MAPTQDELHQLLPASSIVVSGTASDRDDAIRQAGALLVAAGSVEQDYVDQMLDRERTVSTYVGEGIAMPHGTLAAKDDVVVEGLSVVVLSAPIAWGEESVSVVIGIAAHGRQYIALLSQLATVLLVPGRADALRAATSPDEVRTLLAS
jgi:PTS system mannitol-specific IIA component